MAAKGKEKPLQKSITGVKGLTERPAAPQADGGLKKKIIKQAGLMLEPCCHGNREVRMLLRSDRMEAGSGLGLAKKWPDSLCHAWFSYSLKHKAGLSEGLHHTS